jgi:hypothetical protein
MEVALVALVLHVAVATVQVAAAGDLENVATDRHCCRIPGSARTIQQTITPDIGRSLFDHSRENLFDVKDFDEGLGWCRFSGAGAALNGVDDGLGYLVAEIADFFIGEVMLSEFDAELGRTLR